MQRFADSWWRFLLVLVVAGAALGAESVYERDMGAFLGEVVL